MIHIRQPFFSIATAVIYGILGVIIGQGAGQSTTVMLGSLELNQATGWALTGVLFLMAYFSLVHLKDR
jgi:hypothetical protein